MRPAHPSRRDPGTHERNRRLPRGRRGASGSSSVTNRLTLVVIYVSPTSDDVMSVTPSGRLVHYSDAEHELLVAPAKRA